MSDPEPIVDTPDAPAMGERRARWGYGYQDKVATERILSILKDDLKQGDAVFEGVRLADIQAGRVDDFVLVWGNHVEGNSIKWSGDAAPLNWGELIGANGLIKELADGYQSLRSQWPDRSIIVRLQSNRRPSTQTHHSQLISSHSVAAFIRDHWQNGPTPDDSDHLREAWTKVQTCTSLDDESFRDFVIGCQFKLPHPEPSMLGPETRDWQHFVKQFDSLHKAIATWITKHPEQDLIDRRYLMEAIGFRGYQTGLIQRFPTPDIPYAQNGDAAASLKDLIANTDGGYIAVVGPAGVGKSTLVQDVLGGTDYPFFIPYYAFLPDNPGTTRDRSEALTFFQDVVGRLEKLFIRRYSLGISDISEGREALREQMAKANEQYVIQGRKTVLLVDGIDHVAREVGLQSSVLNELPEPAEIPEGFIIVLGSQPQGLEAGTISQNVSYSVNSTNGRRVAVDGLARADVFAIANQFEKPTSIEEREELYQSCQGNPLILTYILNLYRSSDTITVTEAIGQLGTYDGDVNQYYGGRLTAMLANASNRELLGLICRAAPTIPVGWLRSWPEKLDIENLYTGALAPFMKEEDGNLQFIHNSLVSFLRVETRSKLPGADHFSEERDFHSRLADRCGTPLCSEPLGRARILHLNKAARDEDLLAVLSSAWLRDGSSAFLPYSLIRPLILAGLESAWKLNALGEVLRLSLVDFEIDQRSSRTEPGDLAARFLKLEQPDLAIMQVRAAGRILVSDAVAVGFCKDLWFYGASRGLDDLQRLAKVLYLQSKPIAFVYQGEEIDTRQHHDYYDILREWSESAPLFEPLEEIIAQISGLKFKVPEREEGVNEASAKSGLLYGALMTLLRADASFDQLDTLNVQIAELGEPGWIFGSLWNSISYSDGKITENQLEAAISHCGNNVDFKLAYAQHLNSVERHTEAAKVISELQHPRVDTTQNLRSLGFTDVTYLSTLRYLQERYGLEVGPISGVKDDNEEALARVEWAARELGRLRAIAISNCTGIDLTAAFRDIVLFENHPVVLEKFDWRKGYFIGQSKTSLLKELVSVARDFGDGGLKVLKNVILDLARKTNPVILYPHHLRYLATNFFRLGVLDQEQSLNLGLFNTSDAEDEDPIQRQHACFEIALFLHSIGTDQQSSEWVDRASVVAAGAGSHKDYHMSYVADWFLATISSLDIPGELMVVEKFARSLQVAGGAGQYDAAKDLLALVMRFHPGKARHLSIDLLDRGVINLSSVIEGLLLAGAKAGASYNILSNVYKELATLLDPGSTADSAVAVLRCADRESRGEAAVDLLASVRTNSLPSHRMEAARALQDALVDDGLPDLIDREGLKPSRDDSSLQGSLYRLASGEVRTQKQMAQLLGQALDPAEWNPNPGDNDQFDWWQTIKEATIQSTEHLDALIAAFPHPDYRKVEFLAWKSVVFLRIGENAAALELAEEAIGEARDASWFRWYDGAQKITAFAALKAINRDEAISRARTQFGLDLVHGRLNTNSLLANINSIFEFLELDWPAQAALASLNEYFDEVIAANEEVETYASLLCDNSTSVADQGLAEFLVYLLAFPVVDIGVAARRALAKYVILSGNAEAVWHAAESVADSVQWEHVLIALQVAAATEPDSIRAVESRIRACNLHESVAVRSVAKRICQDEGWEWTEVTDDPPYAQILLPQANLTSVPYDEARKLVAGGPTVAANLYKGVFAGLVDGDSEEAQSELLQLYERIDRNYNWADDSRFKQWMRLALAKFWLSQRAIVGREAAMRLLGRRALTGRAKEGAEEAYDFLYPMYDPALELSSPVERPVEMKAMDWEMMDEQSKKWLAGEGGSEWESYPTKLGEDYILAERSWFIRPEWEWPREERNRGVTATPIEAGCDRRVLASRHELVYSSYLRGDAQVPEQLTVWNEEDQLIGPQYRWIAFNAAVAHNLGWVPSPTEPFRWEDSQGALMVRSIYWKDGWIWLVPPRFESLGEGWIVLASQSALDQVNHEFPEAQTQLWVERHSHGNKPYEESWHMSRALKT
jgi:hypothetical protein